MSNVLFCPPTYFDVIDVKNPFMQGASVDKAKARAQWEGVRQAFADAGCGVREIEAVPGLEDMVFAANQTFAAVTPRGEKFIVPSAMRFESRRREVPYFVEYFRKAGYRVIDLALPEGEFLEGGGDLLWNADERFVWAGHGSRSTRGGVARFTQAMALVGVKVVQLELCDPRFYHLDTCLAVLTHESVLIHPAAFTDDALAEIRSRAKRVHEVSEEDALRFTCNGVSVNGRFLVSALTPGLEKILAAEGLQPMPVDTGEFEKSGGSVCCLKQFVP
ncbi:MAG: hypothetical protein HYX26_03925 [Acidobacteriales bacterium]|nr:hypothetical protein [Terriglobales bacterium]